MDFTYNPFTKEAKVKLSRTNLLTLLHKLDRIQAGGESERTITRVTEGDWFLSLTAQEDEDHYGSRERGKMDDETETALSS